MVLALSLTTFLELVLFVFPTHGPTPVAQADHLVLVDQVIGASGNRESEFVLQGVSLQEVWESLGKSGSFVP